MSLLLAVPKEEMAGYVDRQLSFFSAEKSCGEYIDEVLPRVERCFHGLTNKYFHRNGKEYLDLLHSEQYAQFLYFLSRVAWEHGDHIFSNRIYCLNKMLHGIDWYYEVELPEIFWAPHPVGQVLGRAKYSDYFMVTQGCTVGNNHGIYPELGSHIIMHPYSAVMGDVHIGDYVEISSHCLIRDTDVPNDCIVFGESPKLTFVKKSREEMKARMPYFND